MKRDCSSGEMTTGELEGMRAEVEATSLRKLAAITQHFFDTGGTDCFLGLVLEPLVRQQDFCKLVPLLLVSGTLRRLVWLVTHLRVPSRKHAERFFLSPQWHRFARVTSLVLSDDHFHAWFPHDKLRGHGAFAKITHLSLEMESIKDFFDPGRRDDARGYDYDISSKDWPALVSLSAPACWTRIGGLPHLTTLRELDIHGAALRSLDTLYNHVSQLTRLRLRYRYDAALDCARLPHLKHLDADYLWHFQSFTGYGTCTVDDRRSWEKPGYPGVQLPTPARTRKLWLEGDWVCGVFTGRGKFSHGVGYYHQSNQLVAVRGEWHNGQRHGTHRISCAFNKRIAIATEEWHHGQLQRECVHRVSDTVGVTLSFYYDEETGERKARIGCDS